ncbi:MAG TPA: hypothetical protein VKV95_21485 [Terriglobia bacterium]|nr:hypothetical protein [Terriglobia bacterium]
MQSGTRAALLAILIVTLLAASCGGGGYSATTNPPPAPVSIQLSAASLTATQDGAPALLGVTLARPAGNANSVTLSVTSLPTGASAQITSPGTGNAGTIVFNGQGAAAGTYQVTVNASDGATNSSANFSLVIAIVTTIQKSTDTILGVNGKLPEFMSTSFQPAEWDFNFFNINMGATTTLNNLNSQHIRIQGVSQAVPMKANSSPQLPTDWDFTMLDDIVQPVLGVADHSPEFQIAVAPSFMNNSSGHLDITNHLADFVAYSANLVRYYNTGGFTWGGKHFQSVSANKITWWGIFNEYNINGLSPSQYAQLYNAVVPAMLAVDPTIEFSALELADFDSGTGDPRNNLPTFVLPANQGGVSAQVNIVSAHFYSTCNQKDTDTQLFNSVAGFANDVSYIYQELNTRPDLAGVPVWVTENNVNADFDKGGGISACNGTPFISDKRGTSAFFAAWRPYVFSQLGKVGNQALYHWDFDADQQYGEVDFNTGKTYLSYWVDYYLEKFVGANAYCPPVLAPGPQTESPIVCPLPPASILNVNSTETSTVEVLATLNAANQGVVMIANHAVHAAGDNNGPGDPRTVVVDLSPFICTAGGSIPAQLVTIDANTDTSAGPTSVPITASPGVTVTLNGYGVAFLVFSTCNGTGCVCPL